MPRLLAFTALTVLYVAVHSSAVLAANDAPAKTGEFVTYCKSNNDGCVDKVAGISFAMLVTQPLQKQWCPNNETDDVKTLTPKVVAWLTAHPETADKATNDGIQAALSGLFPCKP